MERITYLLIGLFWNMIIIGQQPFYGDRQFISTDLQDTIIIDGSSIAEVDSIQVAGTWYKTFAGGASSMGNSGDMQMSDGLGGFVNSNYLATNSLFNWDGGILSSTDATQNNWFVYDLSLGATDGYFEFFLVDGSGFLNIFSDALGFTAEGKQGSTEWTLDVNGGGMETHAGITIGNSVETAAGTIRYNSGNFEGYDGVSWELLNGAATIPKIYSAAISDESTDITTGTAKLTFRMPYAMTLTEVRASVNEAPTGSTIIIDIKESGVTIFSTNLSIDATEKTSTTAAVPAVISDASLADDAEMTIDITQVGSTTPGNGCKVTLIGN